MKTLRNLLASWSKNKPNKETNEPKLSDDAIIIVDLGSHSVKYGLLGFSDVPDRFFSLVSKTRHFGAYVGEVGSERVGQEALLNFNHGYELMFPSKENCTDIYPHLLKYAVVKSNFPDQITNYYMYHRALQPIYYAASYEDDVIYSDHQFFEANCIAAGCTIPECVVVDMGHHSIRLYRVQNNQVKSRQLLLNGGAHLAHFFAKLISENQNTFEYKHVCAIDIALGEVGKVASGKEEFEKEGYRSILDDLSLLNKDETCFISLLPQELLSQVGKCILYSKLQTRKSTVLEKLGWIEQSKTAPKVHSNAISTFTYRVEHYLAMEVLFQPMLMGRSCISIQEAIKREIDTEVMDVVLTGGMTKCPGLVERLKKELAGKVNITVDEYLIWRGVCILAQ